MDDGIRVLPEDKYNEELVSNLHPPHWVNPEPAPGYNLVVIGAGTAGLVTAAGAAGLGAKVALIEKHLMGGDCLNVGCVPSKCLIRSARAAADVRDAARYGVESPDKPTVDFAAVMERMRKLRSGISHHDSAERFRDIGVDVFLGEGRFTGPRGIEVGGKTLRFAKAVIATGARASEPSIEGLADAGFLTNENVFNLTERPRRLAVVGAGPIGCELAQTFQRLGCEVVLIHKHDRIMNREDPEAAAIVQTAFERDGVELKLGRSPVRVDLLGGNKVIHLGEGADEDKVVVDEILIGVGREPNVEGLGLEAAGVEFDLRTGVRVDDHLRTTNRRIYAAGDVCMRYKFTHAADAAARIVIQNALFWGRKKLSALTIPWSTYTDPEVARLGLSESEAKEGGIRVDVYKRDFADVDRAITDGETAGFVKVICRKGSDEILGATIVARHAGEMIGEITLAMTAGIGLGTLGGVIHPYPTQAEAIKQAGDAYNRTRLTPRVAALLKWWLKLNRGGTEP